MLNKKYYAYAVSLAIFSFSHIAANDSLSVIDCRNVSEEIVREAAINERVGSSLLSYATSIAATQERVATLLEVIHQRRERATQDTVVAPHEWEVAFGVVDASDELFVAKSIDFVFELLWDLAEEVKYFRSIIDDLALNTLGTDRASKLFAYLDMDGSLQDVLKKEIKTIDELESLLNSASQLCEHIATNLPSSIIEVGQKESTTPEVVSVRDN